MNICMSPYRYIALIVLGIQLLPIDSMDALSDLENASRPKKEASSDSEINQRLQNIEKDLNALKMYGPVFIYFLSDNKKIYKLILMIMMYLFLFTFYYRKIRRHDEAMKDDANATTIDSTKIQEVNSADLYVIEIPNSNGQSS